MFEMVVGITVIVVTGIMEEYFK